MIIREYKRVKEAIQAKSEPRWEVIRRLAQVDHNWLGRHRWYSPTLNIILRANPYPEVTDLICRLPLSTLF